MCLCTSSHERSMAVSLGVYATFCQILKVLYSVHPVELSAFTVSFTVSHLTLRRKRKCVKEKPSRNIQYAASCFYYMCCSLCFSTEELRVSLVCLSFYEDYRLSKSDGFPFQPWLTMIIVCKSLLEGLSR